MITPFHAKYYANELILKKASNDDSRLSTSLFDASVTINPHQIDAALFAFKSPLSKGIVLADEVGLGKTIEAGLVMCQLWAELKRKQLVICPASLRKQWSLELLEKFNLNSVILESKTYLKYIKKGMTNPFDQKQTIVIISYNFAARMFQEIGAVNWNLVVIDEAHKLRNSYRPSNKIGKAIKLGIKDKKKLLLTATPLQNNLAELYGLASVIDEHLFGNIKSFRDAYIKEENTEDLKYRLSSFCKRTLRKDVLEYIKYTERFPIAKEFSASDSEQKLYDLVSSYLQQPDTYAFPARHKHLITLIVRKVLASSTYAVKFTLEKILNRLLKIRETSKVINLPISNFIDDDEQELLGESYENFEISKSEQLIEERKIDKIQLDNEIIDLQGIIKLAESIKIDTKSIALLDALNIGFQKTAQLGGNRKALIFTESKRTQEYLKDFLEENGYSGKIVLFNGSNNGKEITKIYKDWYLKNKNTGRLSGSATADKRNAIIEYFRDSAEIMIATESASEGVNLQFCSQVINYDLPWNPQRVEQRIGRCHRYGQKNDVVVINFINNRNYADVRVHELLDEKFNLFRGVFGSSDEILGSIESGVDFEQKILKIYQDCRTSDEIDKAFNALQREMENIISVQMEKTRETLFKNFDADVHERLRLNVSKYLDRYTRYFWALTKYELANNALFNDENKTFDLTHPINTINTAHFSLIKKTEQNYTGVLYRMGHPLGQYVLNTALKIPYMTGKVVFDITNHHGYKVSQVEQLKNKTGYLKLSKYSIQTIENEEHLLFVGILSDGKQLSAEQCQKLFECNGSFLDATIPKKEQEYLDTEIKVYASGLLEKSNQKNLQYICDEENRLDRWSEDMIHALEQNLDVVKKQIRENERLQRIATSTTEHEAIQIKLSELNKRKRTMRAKLEDNEDAIQKKRDVLIQEIHTQMQAKTKITDLFTIEWKVI